MHNMLTTRECATLSRQCIAAAEAATSANSKDTASLQSQTPSLMRLPTFAAAQRANHTKTPFVAALPNDVSQAVDEALLRVAVALDRELPQVVKELFVATGRNKNITLQQLLQASVTTQTQNKQSSVVSPSSLQFASREPAVNVYRDGGEFLPHTDGQSLTLLLPITSQQQGDYTGGGTAFWAPDTRGPRVTPPTVVIQPKAGTALLFGGTVMHAGMPVSTGTRTVIVASFSIKQNTA